MKESNKVKANEQKIKESEEKFHLLFDTIPDAIYIIDQETGKILEVNKAAEKIYGYSREEWLQMKNTDVSAEPDKTKKATSKLPSQIPIRYHKKKDGTIFPLEMMISSYTLNNRRLIIATGRDITERIKSEDELMKYHEHLEKLVEERTKALKESEEKYRLISEDSDDLILAYDDRMEIEYVNGETHERILGYSAHLFWKQDFFFSIIHQDDLKILGSAIKEGYKGGAYKLQIRYKHEKGHYLWFEFRGKTYYDKNGSKNSLVVGRDITDIKLVQQKLIESEHNLQERVKELNVLFEISTIMENRNLTIEESFHEILKKLPLAWQYPNLTCVRIMYKNTIFKSINFQETNWMLSTSIKIGTNRLTIDIFFLEDKTFLKEEEQLIEEVAVRLKGILEQKESEIKLKESEKKYRTFFNSSPNGIGLSNIDGRIIEMNKSMERITGYPVDERHKINIKDIFVDLNQLNSIRTLRKAHGNVRDYEVKLKRKNGTEYFALLDIDLIELGGEDVLITNIRDITEIKTSEKNLMESEEKFRTISEQSLMGIVILQDDRYKYINQAAADMLGYTVEEFLDTPQGGFMNYIHPEDRELVREQATKKQMGMKDVKTKYPYRALTKSGETIWLQNYSRTITFEGKFADLFTMIDITERRKAQQELIESEEKFRTISEQSLMGITILQDDKYKYANQAAADMLGYTVEELLDTPQGGFINYIHPEDREFVREQATKKQFGMKDVITKYPYMGLTKSGETIWVQNYSCTITYEGRYADLITMNDLTERKKAEEKLKESEEKYRHLFETAPLFIGLLNKEGILIDCNDAINEILSIHIIEDVKGKNLKEIFSLNEKNKPIIPLFEEAIKNIFEGVNQEGFDFRLNRSIGDYFWLHFEGTLIEIEKQKLVQFILQDITTRKKAEQLLQETIEDLARTNTELERFAYVTSHDLKEPLRMIISFIQLLEKRYKDKLDEDANDFIAFIVDGAKRMQDLIDSLLEYSRIGRYNKEFENIDLNDVLKDVIDNLKQLINETNAEVIYDLLPSLTGNEVELIQLLQNLISNAIKFHKEGEPPVVHISAKLQKNQWIFSVRDNGIGIDPKDFDRIFIIFQRLHKKDEFGGTGIGLAICQKIIQRHRGKIWVESELGKSSTFYFSIPKEIDIKS